MRNLYKGQAKTKQVKKKQASDMMKGKKQSNRTNKSLKKYSSNTLVFTC